ncbi:Inhibitor of sigma-G Gin [Hathewaya proteolytica DSM 3090]|uniref:Inhibitor of sigma-G Gin n=1 Tax=Hathewaya proteolytica DSM 3090 TaxID=1121331 RepID=A0A1M6T3C5_9CLOT|nr:Inhibitor of sigma-G Gin [Hathewaya proteolytica DSM 3090]
MCRDICSICERPLDSGIMILGKTICCNCEEKIIQADINTDFYEYYKEKLKKCVINRVIKKERYTCNKYHL